MSYGKYWGRGAGLPLMAIGIILFAGGVAHALCPGCTAFGTGTLAHASGVDDSAFGFQVLSAGPNSGVDNTAVGFRSLRFNTTGVENTGTGWESLELNTSGYVNTATGFEALIENTTGYENTATGTGALGENTTGYNNIGIGYDAGANLTDGFNNIDIYDPGVADESDTIRNRHAGHSDHDLRGRHLWCIGHGRYGVRRQQRSAGELRSGSRAR